MTKIVSLRLLALLCALVVMAGCGSGTGSNLAGGSGISGTPTMPTTSDDAPSSSAPSSSSPSSTSPQSSATAQASGGASSGGGTSGAGGSGGGGSGGSGGSGGGGGGGSGGGDSGGDSGFAWVPFGPSNPDSPPPIQWYNHLENYSCDFAGSPDSLWTSVLALCEVVANKDQGKWDEVKHAAGTGSCLDSAASALVDRALAWHKAHPGALPEVRPAEKGKVACPPEITKVQVQGSDGMLSDKLEGPTEGGTVLLLTADGLTGDDTFSIGGVKVPADESGGFFVTVVTPAVEKAGKVSITFSNKYGKADAASRFTYADATKPEGGGQPGGGG